MQPNSFQLMPLPPKRNDNSKARLAAKKLPPVRLPIQPEQFMIIRV